MNRLAVMQDALLKKAQLEALGQVAGGVAHDFNNVLTPIIGTSEMLATSLDTMSPEEVLESINLIQMAATDAATLTRRLRSSFVSDEEVEFSIVDLATIAASAVQMSRTEWGRRSMEENTPTFKIVEDLEPDVVTWGNHGRLRQALVNLIVNAIHASPLGGTIRVGVRQSDDGPLLSVQDFGTGMAPEVLENCLKPLYTTKGSEGTGLGLMNVSATAREHGGRLEIESEFGIGTTITLHLPPPDTTAT